MPRKGSSGADIWTWLGDGDEDPERDIVKYAKACVQRAGEDGTRTFKVGEFVVTSGKKRKDGPWFAQVVEMLHDKSKTPAMRATLRWFYRRADLNAEVKGKIEDKSIRSDEIFVTDHVEKSGSNSLTVIAGRAHLAKTETQLQNLKTNPANHDGGWRPHSSLSYRLEIRLAGGCPPPEDLGAGLHQELPQR